MHYNSKGVKRHYNSKAAPNANCIIMQNTIHSSGVGGAVVRHGFSESLCGGSGFRVPKAQDSKGSGFLEAQDSEVQDSLKLRIPGFRIP